MQRKNCSLLCKMGRGRHASLVQDVREIAGQHPGKAYGFLQDATSVFEQGSFSQSSGTTPSTLSRTGILALVSPSQSPLLNEDYPKREAFPSLDYNDGAAGPSPDAAGWFPGGQLRGLTSESPSYGSRLRPRRLNKLYLATPGAPQPAAPVSAVSVRSALSSSSSRSRRLTPVNLRVASSNGHGSAGSPVHRPLVPQDMCDECLLNGEEASSVTILAEELQTDVLFPLLSPVDMKTLPAACMQATVAQPLRIPSPSRPVFPRCQSLLERAIPSPHVVNYLSHSLVRSKAMLPDSTAAAPCDKPPAAATAVPVQAPVSVAPVPYTGASCRVSLKLHSAHVDLLRLHSLRALAQLLLPSGWALCGMGVRPGCIELVLDYTRLEVGAQGTYMRADASATTFDRGTEATSARARTDVQTKEAGDEVPSVSENHLTQLVSFLHQQGLVDEAAEPSIFIQANQQVHRVQWQQQLAGAQVIHQTPSSELVASAQHPRTLIGSPGLQTVDRPPNGDTDAGATTGKADGGWMCAGGPTSLGPAASVEPVVLPTCVTASCTAGHSAGVVLYVGVPRRGLRDCTVRSLGRFLPTRELLRMSALAAMAGFDMATSTKDAPADTALVAGKAPFGVPYIAHARDGKDSSSFAGGAGTSSYDSRLEENESLSIDWLLAGAAAHAVGGDGEVLILSVSELPIYGALLQVELRLPWVDGRTESLTPASWRSSGEAMELAYESQGPSAGSQHGMHAAHIPQGFAASLSPALEPLTAAAPVLFLRACQYYRSEGTGAGRGQGAADGDVRCRVCREDGPPATQRDTMWGAIGAAREITCLRARMTAGGLAPGPGAGAAALEFLTDLGLLLDVAACTAMREEDRAAGASERYGDSTAATATRMSQEVGDAGERHGEDMEKMSFDEQVRAVLLSQLGDAGGGYYNGVERVGCGGLGGGFGVDDEGASLLAPPLGQHLADTAVTLLAACTEMSLPYTARLVMQLAGRQLRLANPEVLLQAAADGDTGFVFRLQMLLAEAEMPPASHDPQPVDAINVGDVLAVEVTTHAEERSLGAAAGAGGLQAARVSLSSMLSAEEHADGQEESLGLFSFPRTGTQSDVVDVPSARTPPTFQSQPGSECSSTVGLDEPVVEDTGVGPNERISYFTRFSDFEMAGAIQPSDSPRPSEIANMMGSAPEVIGDFLKSGCHATESNGWTPAISAARQVQGRGPVCKGLMQQFGDQVLACIMGMRSPAMEQAFWRDTAAELQAVSRLYAYITLALVSISAIRAGLEDGLTTALFMVLYQGGQAALLAAYGKWGHGQPNRLFNAVIVAIVWRSVCHALLSWGLAPLPSFVRPVSRAWGDIFNEAGAKAVVEQLPFWLYLLLLVFVELPMVYALYSYLDGHGQGMLTRNVLMRLASFIVLKTSVTVAAQAVMRMRFQARLPRAKCE